MTVEDDEEGPWAPSVSLSHDGKIEGLHLPQDQRRPPEAWERQPLPQTDQPLELALPEAPPLPPPEPVAPQRELPLVAIAVGIALLAASAAGLVILLRKPAGDAAAPPAASAPPLPARSSAAPAAEEHVARDDTEGPPALIVESDPPGAAVFVGAEELGRTPLLGSNDYAQGGKVEVRLLLDGYRPWSGTFTGGTKARLHATLRRK